ncbi:hemolysin activation/secretion protein [Xenococcus sp. PCC 7305]|uniref:ShlB/FhaC/HecB family hemolysin secretion/activation protein n=1 Tax=Xenococcus sp. PCC 7305 TaxID=102125 RepID=UPI0002AC368D|nr:ShlB/FhaC/HecB family hemolysin secretion/activation protein [Xenococcus sp. PCC 7305]ELS01517.1 hemolysin activation/secretion protein [Xenococcus sp. PCC 7305]
MNYWNRLLLIKQIELKSLAKIAIISFFASFCQPMAIKAQTMIAQLPLPETPTPDIPEPLAPLQPSLPQLETTPTFVPLEPQDVPGTIIVKKFEIIGNTVLEPQIIEDAIAEYTLRPISFVELLQVPRKITQLYLDAGYITSGAILSPQAITDRTVQIEIVPGTISEIKVIGLQKLKPSYVRSRLARATQPPLNQTQLLKALQLLQIDPLIANISAELSAGIEPNSSILEVTVEEEPDTFSLGLNFDNYRVSSVGTFRRQLELNENNLLGYGDRFNIAYLNTDGTHALDNLSYEFPLNNYQGKLKLVYGYSDNNLTQEPFDALDIENQISNYEVKYAHKLYKSLSQELIAGISFIHTNSRSTFLDGLPFPSPSGASDDEGKTKVSAIRLIQDYTNRNQRRVWALRSQLSIGIDAFDSNVSVDRQDSKFVAWAGQANYYRILTNKTAFLLRSRMQFADDGLVPLEQFSIGGVYTVRGYAQNILIADNGFFVSAEIQQNLLRLEKSRIALDLTPFIDFGRIWNTDRELNQPRNTIAGAGLGLRLDIKNNVILRLDWGIPFSEIETAGDSLQENGFYFSLRTKAF